MNWSLRLAAALALPLVSLTVLAAPGNLRPDYGVYCIQGRLSVEQKHIEELKRAFGDNVCRLDQDPSQSGAREKEKRLGGSGAGCSCEM